MKSRLLLLFILLSLNFLNSCKKENDLVDFRDQYIGKFQVIETLQCYGPCWECYSQKDTVISVGYGLTDSTLSVLGRDVYLDSTGFYSGYHYGLSFRNDSIFSNYMNGGLGCGKYEVYVGVRISKEP